jgi:hypothetical protein
LVGVAAQGRIVHVSVFSGCYPMIHPALKLSREEISGFCRRNRIRSLALFGSATREDFKPGSDVDVLVEFEEGARPDLFEMIDMEQELAALMGRPVDLLERSGVERSANYIRRKHILSTAEPVYVAR